MIIIKKGNPPKIKKDYFTGSCRECGCVVECSLGEATLIEAGRGDRFGSDTYAIKCPESGCKEMIFLEVKEKKYKYATN